MAKAILRTVIGNEMEESASGSGLKVRVDVLECGHRIASSLGTSGYSNPKRRKCFKCPEPVSQDVEGRK